MNVNPSSMFCIKNAYVSRVDNEFFDDTLMTDEWQREVYELAVRASSSLRAKTILDVGCGSGFKLIKNFGHLKTIGLELGPTLGFLRNTYPDRQWEESDFLFDPGPVDLIICADVIEHIPDPDLLMHYLSSIPFRALILSTPERSLVYGFDHSGPPANQAHCREWTHQEFREYVSRWFTVVEGGITNKNQATQVLVCVPMSEPLR